MAGRNRNPIDADFPARALTWFPISWGTWTPTLSNVANVDASTPQVCQYVRILSIVICSGRYAVDPTTITTLTQLGISLPIASNFGATQHAAGVASGSGILESAAIIADVTNDRMEANFVAGSVANHSQWFIAMYQII